MRTIKTTVYTFDELSDEAKQSAIDNNRDINIDYEWWDYIYNDTIEIGKILGIDITNIYFSGFSSQGDGACFEGGYSYKKGSVKEIKKYAPLDRTLHEIAERLQDVQKSNIYQAMASVKHSGRYNHEYCTNIDVYHNENARQISDEDFETITDCLRDFMRWIYSQLKKNFGICIQMKL